MRVCPSRPIFEFRPMTIYSPEINVLSLGYGFRVWVSSFDLKSHKNKKRTHCRHVVIRVTKPKFNSWFHIRFNHSSYTRIANIYHHFQEFLVHFLSKTPLNVIVQTLSKKAVACIENVLKFSFWVRFRFLLCDRSIWSTWFTRFTWLDVWFFSNQCQQLQTTFTLVVKVINNKGIEL